MQNQIPARPAHKHLTILAVFKHGSYRQVLLVLMWMFKVLKVVMAYQPEV